ncbi:MAG: UvrD-helicase domain-containing protein [Magnetococcales bacterium]|nr:UvrD-helicase domain-containing protein [Magnetococcales bacterium]
MIGTTMVASVGPVADTSQRRRALDPHTSFIVQAPAGSGKTGLLIQRFLVLLARVEQPEHIVAITFTRKAAAEMRQRIMAILTQAYQVPAAQRLTTPMAVPTDPYQQQLLTLAQAVLAQGQRLNWRLLHNPERLRIMTIDALCALITRQMPILSGFGTQPDNLDDNHASRCYRQAAQETLNSLVDTPWGGALQQLFDHLDNRWDQAEQLLAQLLQRRDQWLRHVIRGRQLDHNCRSQLQQALQHSVCERLTATLELVPPWLQQQLPELARHAAHNLADSPKADTLTRFLRSYRQQHPTGPWQWPGIASDQTVGWLMLTALLLTNQGNWRQKIDASIGFPPFSREEKQLLKDILQQLSEGTYEPLRCALQALQQSLPTVATYTDPQWQILQALLQLLPVAVAQLQRLFVRINQVDFIEIALRALQALGTPEQPTDLALRLDGDIQHLLVDEFQDTSRHQYQLLQQLTAGWSGDDGRTLFLVGDPMQSIYRFREADVGLFLQVKQRGIGAIRPEFLCLTVNFRSQAGLIAWSNDVFQYVMAAREDIETGAIPFTPALPASPQLDGGADLVSIHALSDSDAEAARVVEIIRSIPPSQTIAVLARARAGLYPVIAALQQAGLPFQAVDIASLAQSRVVVDLLSLTRALLLPGDRLSWLALLRSPFCGLSLADMAQLAATDDTASSVWELLQRPEQRNLLSEEGQQRLERLITILTPAFNNRYRSLGWGAITPLRRWVAGIWQAMGGPLLLNDPIERDNAELFFDLLQQSEQGGELADPTLLEERIQSVRAVTNSDAAAARIQLMTIHKAKGLEFDVVIVPALDRASRGSDQSLLLWHERSSAGQTDLLLAPVQRRDQADPDPIYRLLHYWHEQADQHEKARLLYVAVTRARHHLHLLASVAQAEDGTPKPPPSGSLLRLLWPYIDISAQPPLPLNSQPLLPQGEKGSYEGVASCLPPCLPRTPHPPASSPIELPPFQWAGELIRCVGVVVHRCLCVMAMSPSDRYLTVIRHHLMRLGVPLSRLDEAQQQVQLALQRTNNDATGQWLLSAQHQYIATEWALSGVVDGRPQRIVVDRTFVDRDGTRWIVDFKTSRHSGSDLELFLDHEEERYRSQLRLYAQVMRQMAGEQQRPIRLGLYFPLFPAWREVVR